MICDWRRDFHGGAIIADKLSQRFAPQAGETLPALEKGLTPLQLVKLFHLDEIPFYQSEAGEDQPDPDLGKESRWPPYPMYSRLPDSPFKFTEKSQQIYRNSAGCQLEFNQNIDRLEMYSLHDIGLEPTDKKNVAIEFGFPCLTFRSEENAYTHGMMEYGMRFIADEDGRYHLHDFAESSAAGAVNLLNRAPEEARNIFAHVVSQWTKVCRGELCTYELRNCRDQEIEIHSESGRPALGSAPKLIR